MNEADSPSINLDDLRLVPDWLREEPLAPSKQYASHEGRDEYPRGDRGSGRPPRRDGGFGGQGGGGQRPVRTDSRPRGDGRGGPGPRGQDRPGRSDDRRSFSPQAPVAPVTPAPVRIEFLPETRCLANIVKQIRTTHMAYPLFGTARMFLQEPERHLLQVMLEPAASQAGTVLYQLDENGPIALDRQVLERIAFEAMKDRFYVEQTVTKEPPKGNFTNVARCRTGGELLGPTNYHGYQPALRALYESKYSRRMPFEAFRQSIEVVSDPALVERWKNEANTITTIVTREGEPPTVLQSTAEARAHFRQYYFEALLRQGTSFGLPGAVARSLPEAGMMMAIRQSNENELRYPAQFVQHLRKGLQDAGLHIFKHRKRIVYVAVTRPLPFTEGVVSANVAAILEYIGQKPLCTRKDLAGKFLSRYVPAASTSEPVAPTAETAPIAADVEPAAEVDPAAAPAEQGTGEKTATDPLVKAKAALAAELRFLVQAGHIIEFHNGTFDLPLGAKVKEESQPAGRSLPRPNPLFTGKRKDDRSAGARPVGKPESSAAPEPVIEANGETETQAVAHHEEDGEIAAEPATESHAPPEQATSAPEHLSSGATSSAEATETPDEVSAHGTEEPVAVEPIAPPSSEPEAAASTGVEESAENSSEAFSGVTIDESLASENPALEHEPAEENTAETSEKHSHETTAAVS